MKIKKLKKVTIKRKKWLHGHKKTKRKVLDGRICESGLLDDKGYMCCLGQWCEQADVPRERLRDISQPSSLEMYIPLLTDKSGTDTKFCRAMMALNDSCKQSIKEQEKELIKMAKAEGVKLVFVD